LKRPVFAAAAAVCVLGAATAALSWGATGHRLIGVLAMRALPADLPAFLRTPAAAIEMGELAREPDRWRASGKLHDADRDPAHFVNVDDEGRVEGGPKLESLPATRQAYDTALRAVGDDASGAGWLPYAMADGWQQVVKDFAYWRITRAGERLAKTSQRRAWFAADRVRREALLLRDLGVLAHYIGDGGQPLHVTQHHSGWGEGPNPKGYTTRRIHSPLEGAFVRAQVPEAEIRSRLSPYRPCTEAVERCTAIYLAASWQQVEPLYQLEKDGGFVDGDPRGRAFMATRLAAAASELRDRTADAWKASADVKVGWPEVSVAEVEAGRVDAYDSLNGLD
jgi:hypothetical protein